MTSGVDTRVAQELLGHEDTTMTAKIYPQVLDELKRQAVDAIGGTIERNSRHQPGTNSSHDEHEKGKA